MPDQDRAEWIVFVAGHADKPVRVIMDYDILGALWALDQPAWAAVLEYVEGHIRSRENSKDELS